MIDKIVNICAWCSKEKYGVFDDPASVLMTFAKNVLRSSLRERTLHLQTYFHK